MINHLNGDSPFRPQQPIPAEHFVGRKEHIEKMMIRGARGVIHGRPYSYFVQGEYGIGKSSLVKYVQWLAKSKYKLHPIYVSLGKAESLKDMSDSIVKAAIESGIKDPEQWDLVTKWLTKYISKIDMFGIKVDFEAIKKDAPDLSSVHSMLNFMEAIIKNMKTNGVFLVLDDINGLAEQPIFSKYLKGLVDVNAMMDNPLPIFVILSGIEENRRTLIKNYEPVARIFDIIDVKTLTEEETSEFFAKAFDSIGRKIEDKALKLITDLSYGQPRIMHHIGDAILWVDTDDIIDESDALKGIKNAANEIGSKYIELKMLNSIRSEVYKSILRKLAHTFWGSEPWDISEILPVLTEDEQNKYSAFISRMKELNILRDYEWKGSNIFNNSMMPLYIRLNHTLEKY